MEIYDRITELSLRERETLAGKLGTTPAYLNRIAYSRQGPGPKLARKMAKAMGISLAEVRPDLWGDA